MKNIAGSILKKLDKSAKIRVLGSVLLLFVALLMVFSVYSVFGEGTSGAVVNPDNTDWNIPISLHNRGVGEKQVIKSSSLELASFFENYTCWDGKCIVPFYLKNLKNISYNMYDLKIIISDDYSQNIANPSIEHSYYKTVDYGNSSVGTELFNENIDGTNLSIEPYDAAYFVARFDIPKGAKGKFNIEVWDANILLLKLDPNYFWDFSVNIPPVQQFDCYYTCHGTWTVAGGILDVTGNPSCQWNSAASFAFNDSSGNDIIVRDLNN